MNLFADFDARIKKALETIDLVKAHRDAVDFGRVTVESPRDPSHGDVATNAAMVLAKPLGTNPRALAELGDRLAGPEQREVTARVHRTGRPTAVTASPPGSRGAASRAPG